MELMKKGFVISCLLLLLLEVRQAYGAERQSTENLRSNPTTKMRQIANIKLSKTINAVSWTRSGKLVVMSDFGSEISVFDTHAWRLENSMRRYGGAYSGNSFAALPSGNVLTPAPAGLADNLAGHYARIDPRFPKLDRFSLIEWNVNLSTYVQYYPDPDSELHVDRGIRIADAFSTSADGAMAAAINDGLPLKIIIYDLRRHAIKKMITELPTTNVGATNFAQSISISADKRRVAVGFLDGHIAVYSIESGHILYYRAYTRVGEYRISQIAFSPRNDLIAFGISKNVNIDHENRYSTYVVNADDGKSIAELEADTAKQNGFEETTSVRSLDWNGDQTRLAVGDQLSLRVWEVRGLQFSENTHISIANGVYSVKFSSDNDLAVASGNHVLIYR